MMMATPVSVHGFAFAQRLLCAIASASCGRRQEAESATQRMDARGQHSAHLGPQCRRSRERGGVSASDEGAGGATGAVARTILSSEYGQDRPEGVGGPSGFRLTSHPLSVQALVSGLARGENGDFTDGSDLLHVVGLGLKEHWLIPQDRIRVFPDDVLGRGGFGVVCGGCVVASPRGRLPTGVHLQ